MRSDDAVGPILIERLSADTNRRLDGAIDLEWVYQLQVENAEQWCRYDSVIVVDADAGASQPVTWREIFQQEPVAADAFNSHKQSPEFIYQLMQQFFISRTGPRPTQVFVLGIQAQIFELGENLSSKSEQALQQAENFLVQILSDSKAGLRQAEQHQSQE